MDPSEREDIRLPSDELASAMSKLRSRAETDEDEDDEFAPAMVTSRGAPATAITSDPEFEWLSHKRRETLRRMEVRPMMSALIDWVAAVAGPSRATAVFHTAVGKISIPVLQHVKANGNSVLVLMLDPSRLSFHPVQGTELLFSLEYAEQGPVDPYPMTVLSGPWTMPGFPVAFLLLWDQNTTMQDDMVKDARDKSAPLQRMADQEDEREAVKKVAAASLENAFDDLD